MPQQTFGVGTVPLVLKVGERVTFICSSGCAGFISVPGEAVAQTITAGSMYDYGGYSVQREVVLSISAGTVAVNFNVDGSQFWTQSQADGLQALVSGYGISLLRRALLSAWNAAVPAYAGTCTVTAGQTSSSIASSVLVASSTGTGLDTTHFDMPAPFVTARSGATSFIESRGAHTGTSTSGNAALCRSHWRFSTDAPIFEIQLYGVANSNYAVLCDGALVTEQATKASNGTTYYDKLDFSAEAVPRKRRVIDIYGNSSFYFAGIRTTGVDTVWAGPAQPTMAIIGDSYTGGSATGYRDWCSVLARGLGCRELKSGSGGTGYLATNSGASMKFRDRFSADISALQPEIIVIAGGINDIPGYGSNSWTLADLQAEAAALYTQALAENQNAAVIVIGPWRGSSGNAGSYTSPSMDTALQDAAASVAGYGSRLLYVPTLNDPMGPWQYGGLSTGNFSIYGNTGDGTHMLEPGYEYLGNRAIDAVRKAILRAAA